MCWSEIWFCEICRISHVTITFHCPQYLSATEPCTPISHEVPVMVGFCAKCALPGPLIARAIDQRRLIDQIRIKLFLLGPVVVKEYPALFADGISALIIPASPTFETISATVTHQGMLLGPDGVVQVPNIDNLDQLDPYICQKFGLNKLSLGPDDSVPDYAPTDRVLAPIGTGRPAPSSLHLPALAASSAATAVPTSYASVAAATYTATSASGAAGGSLTKKGNKKGKEAGKKGPAPVTTQAAPSLPRAGLTFRDALKKPAGAR
ncbi:uncharacterized protein F4822DRAFT_425691 [Hypoxylon trugodes]|uniref:uncharacterized protein n=1 Tax=Hypoxylon trugodes TaxID=326681 RepID=UPI002199B6C9|nr:uncharacterized protein F4822DRAFT_425691 [Hypoxylon trugodes]KAI1392486.1 hypothetical protein F4822DRAFT_425691 [Hypoxylon trugodes]